jgi:hypothetical protein
VRVVYLGDEPSRFMFFASDVEFEHPEMYGPKDVDVVCEHCVLELHPDARRGMELAREWGASRFEAGVWSGEID